MIEITDFPAKLSGWTYETVLGIVRKYEYEPGFFDFKGILVPPRDVERTEYLASLRRTVCSLANGDGGYILFGVRDRNQPANSPEERIIGVSLRDDLRKVFWEKIASIERPIYFDASPRPIEIPQLKDRGVFVVYIPQSPLRPHIDEETGQFYRRGEGGTAVKMGFYEIREQMMYTEERLRKLTLFRLELAQHRKTAMSIYSQGDNVVQNLLRFDTSAFKIILADVCGFFPSSSKLLELLLDIPIYANLINERLSRETIPTVMYQRSMAERAKPILENLTFFLELCLTCEQELEKIFGALEGVEH